MSNSRIINYLNRNKTPSPGSWWAKVKVGTIVYHKVFWNRGQGRVIFHDDNKDKRKWLVEWTTPGNNKYKQTWCNVGELRPDPRPLPEYVEELERRKKA